MLQNDCFSFHLTSTAFAFCFPLFCKILGWSILIQSFAKLIMGDILADTAILGNVSKKEPLCSCYKHTSRGCLQLNGMAAEKRGFWLSGKSVNMQLFLGFRLLLSLRCVFDNKLTPFISGNGFFR